MKGKIVSVLLLLGLVIPGLINFLSYQSGRNACRFHFKDIRENLSSADMETFVFPSDSPIAWEIRNKEFILHGKLYDVISIHVSGPSLVIKCVGDKNEDDVLLSYAKSIEHRGNDSKELPNVPKEKDNLFFQVSINWVSIACMIPDPVFRDLSIEFNTVFIEIFSPPPEFYYAFSPLREIHLLA